MTAPRSLRLVVALAPPLLRDALAHVLRELLEADSVETAASTADLRRLVEARHPDIVLADDRLLAEVRPAPGAEETPAYVAVLLGDGPPDPVRVRALLRSGVLALVSDADGVEVLGDAVRAVVQGEEPYLSPRVAARVAPAARRATGAHDVGMTPREWEIVERVARGHAVAQIADDLGLTPGTVRNYLSGAYAALGVASRAEAIAWAWRHGYVRGEPSRTGTRESGPRSDREKQRTHDT